MGAYAYEGEGLRASCACKMLQMLKNHHMDSRTRLRQAQAPACSPPTCTAAGAAAAAATEPGGGALALKLLSGCGRLPAAPLPAASYRCTAPHAVAAANQEPAALKARLRMGESCVCVWGGGSSFQFQK